MTETDDAALARFDEQVKSLTEAAFAAGCRLAVTQPVKVMNEWIWIHVILSAGEAPPAGLGRKWTIFEQRNGMAVGRSV